MGSGAIISVYRWNKGFHEGEHFKHFSSMRIYTRGISLQRNCARKRVVRDVRGSFWTCQICLFLHRTCLRCIGQDSHTHAKVCFGNPLHCVLAITPLFGRAADVFYGSLRRASSFLNDISFAFTFNLRLEYATSSKLQFFKICELDISRWISNQKLHTCIYRPFSEKWLKIQVLNNFIRFNLCFRLIHCGF